MAKLFDQQQLSAGVQEFEEHLRRRHGRDWTADCPLAKPQNDAPPPPRRDGVRKAAARNARAAAPAKGKPRPAGSPIEIVHSRRLILALAALVMVGFAGAMSFALMGDGAPSAEEVADIGAVEADPSMASPSSQAPQANMPPAVAATSETYVATIRPDGSLAPDTTPGATVATPPAKAPAPSPDAISAVIKSGDQPEAPPSAQAEANAPSESPAAAKPAKERAAARSASVASVGPADGDAAAGAANPADSGRPAAAKISAAKPVAKPLAPKPRAAAVAAATKTEGAPQAQPPQRAPAPDEGAGAGIFDGAKQAVGSLTGAVKKLVGAD